MDFFYDDDHDDLKSPHKVMSLSVDYTFSKVCWCSSILCLSSSEIRFTNAGGKEGYDYKRTFLWLMIMMAIMSMMVSINECRYTFLFVIFCFSCMCVHF